MFMNLKLSIIINLSVSQKKARDLYGSLENSNEYGVLIWYPQCYALSLRVYRKVDFYATNCVSFNFIRSLLSSSYIGWSRSTTENDSRRFRLDESDRFLPSFEQNIICLGFFFSSFLSTSKFKIHHKQLPNELMTNEEYFKY